MCIKQAAFIGMCILAVLSLISCNSSKGLTDYKEDFDGFYDRFHSDESFQMSRIVFPLAGSSEDADGSRIWTKDNWISLKVKIYDVDTSTYKVEYERKEDTFTQKFWLPGTGFSAEYRFKRKMGKWYLVYAFDSNL